VAAPRLTRRDLLALAAAAATGACSKVRGPAPPSRPAATVSAEHLPRWRGFNLIEKLTLEVDAPYLEWDFDRVAEWGFDFVRLPLDYRIWTQAPGSYREPALREIDQAISWGRRRGIHVCLALHRAPGYCTNPPREPLDLWADGAQGDQARAQFAAQWRMFAERYRGVPARELSFNLLNEPPSITGAQYLRAAREAVVAIRQSDPGRLVIADGTRWGREPATDLASLGVAQSTRGYAPLPLTGYRASFLEGSSDWTAEPIWPIPAALNGHLYGPMKPELARPLILRGDFAKGPVAVTVHRVSHKATLVVRADGAEVLRRAFEPGAGAGEWRESSYRAEWGIYQARYDRRYAGEITKGARELRVELVDGDWLTFSRLEIGGHVLEARDYEWGVLQGEHAIDATGALVADAGLPRVDGASLFATHVEPWMRFSREAKVGVHVGEWGAFQHTPHAVTLAWMRDCLANWRRAGFGWALWNLRGAFGVVDSGRSDVAYEAYQGHELDRRMLEVLRGDASA
jgi:hypothetical protein